MAAPTMHEFDGEQYTPDDLPQRPQTPKNPSMAVETVRFDALRANVRVSGELDLATAAPLWAVLEGHVASGRRFLRLDLAHVSFLDATALTGINRIHQDLLQRRGTLVIVGVRPHLARVLHLTGLDEVLFIGGSRGDDDVLFAVQAASRLSG